MLIGFFKPSQECASNCRVVSFCDRIWLESDLTAKILRSFTIEIPADSPCGLSELRMLLPFPASAVTNLKGLNDTAFNPTWYFNTPALRANRDYDVKKKVASESDSYGLIDDDGIRGIKVFRGNLAVPSHFALKNATVIVFRFQEQLNPGEKTQYRVSFEISGFGKNTSTQLANYYELRYFDSPKFKEECELQSIDSVIPIYLAPQETAGGFSVLTYAPPDYERLQGFDHAEESRDAIGPDAAESVERAKCVWQLHDVWNLQKPTEVRLEREFILRGTFGRRIDTDLLGQLKGLQEQVKEQKREIRLATVVAIIGAVIAIVALIPLLPDILKWIGRHLHSAQNAKSAAISMTYSMYRYVVQTGLNLVE
jgi:hypothetical protein